MVGVRLDVLVVGAERRRAALLEAAIVPSCCNLPIGGARSVFKTVDLGESARVNLRRTENGEVAKPPASRAPMARRAARRFLRFDFLAEPSSRGIGRLPVYAQRCDDGVLWAANDAPVVMR